MCTIIGTLFLYWAYFTLWFSGNTKISSKKNQRVVHLLFDYVVKKYIYFSISFFGSFCFYYSYTIEYSMNMSIDTDIRHIIEYREYYFRSLNANTRKALYSVQIVWNYSIMFLGQDGSGFFDKARFIPKKIYIFKMLFYFSKGHL